MALCAYYTNQYTVALTANTRDEGTQCTEEVFVKGRRKIKLNTLVWHRYHGKREAQRTPDECQLPLLSHYQLLKGALIPSASPRNHQAQRVCECFN